MSKDTGRLQGGYKGWLANQEFTLSQPLKPVANQSTSATSNISMLASWDMMRMALILASGNIHVHHTRIRGIFPFNVNQEEGKTQASK